ncbi:DUF3040 domain-containing protein [Pseudonocardia nigra]|uniref:DUF3040 domain-containing protein n=1 Tax=Pseudonocardia nigra TaxID=1921578 RepID=UPI001C5EB49B|nr:DUF3040 domain-containing protein [Pseudonocardia nigra]
MEGSYDDTACHADARDADAAAVVCLAPAPEHDADGAGAVVSNGRAALTRRERRALRATEKLLAAEDPKLAAALATEAARVDRVPERLAGALIVVAGLLLAGGVLANDASMRMGALLVAMVTLPVILVVATARRTSGG